VLNPEEKNHSDEAFNSSEKLKWWNV
jgi:hypothetical protein